MNMISMLKEGLVVEAVAVLQEVVAVDMQANTVTHNIIYTQSSGNNIAWFKQHYFIIAFYITEHTLHKIYLNFSILFNNNT